LRFPFESLKAVSTGIIEAARPFDFMPGRKAQLAAGEYYRLPETNGKQINRFIRTAARDAPGLKTDAPSTRLTIRNAHRSYLKKSWD
jgi:hypothetical protein